MKMTNMKKKVLLSSLAFAMVTTSTLVSIPRVYGEDTVSAVVDAEKPKEEVKTEAVKALLTADGKVMGRGNDDNSNSKEIESLNTITDLMIGNMVTKVDAEKFKGLTNLTTLSFKDSAREDASTEEKTKGIADSKVATIGANAFKGTGITSVTFPKALTTIDAGAFADTPALTTATFTNSTLLENIKASAFENSGLTTLDLSPINGSTSLNVEEKAFKGNTKLATVTLTSKMTEFKSEVFASTKLTTIEIKQEVTKVDKLAFKGTPLANLTVAAGNTTFYADANVLYNEGKTKLLLYPEGKTGTEFTIPETVTHIEPNAFGSAPALTKVITGTALTHIGDYAFDGASKLIGVELKSALTNIGQYAFKDTPLAKIALPNKITEITTMMFAGATKLATLDLRKATGLTTVQTDAFKETALKSMIIGTATSALTTITAGAFSSTAESKMISFLNESDAVISGDETKSLIEKHKELIKPENGSWTFNVKLPTPKAVVDYTNMKLTGLELSTQYTIGAKEYTTDGEGKLELLKEWGGTTISIVRKAALAQQASDPQSLEIKGIYTVSIDGKKDSVKEVGSTVTITAPEKPGYVFTEWVTTDVSLTTPKQKKTTFTMPEKDVNLTQKYTEITVETPTKDLVFNGKNDVIVALTSPLANFNKLAVDKKDLTKGKDYIVSGTNTTIITLKKSYLNTLTATTEFTVTFAEGGDKTFSISLYGEAPVAAIDYKTMKLTGLVANAQYKINDELKTADEAGNIKIEKAWGGKALEIIKVGTDAETDSKPQNLILKEFYSITIDGKEFSFTTAGMKVTLKAERKEGYKIKEWTATGVTLTDANKEEITFEMPANDVVLKTSYMKVITTKLADMIYDGTKEVIIRIDIPMNEFQYIEYNGQKLTRNVDYIVSSGSTIITFTKTYLDKMKGDMTGIKAVFTNNSATFTIKRMLPVTPANSTKVEATKASAKNPKTGDSTNIYVLCMMLLGSIGTVYL